MKPLSLAEIRRITGAPGAGDLEISRICTDTRQIAPASLFIALRGDRFDAHDFLDQAAAGGAVAAMIDRTDVNPPPGIELVRVKNTRQAMGTLARQVRRQLRGKVVAVAGSNGKTGTKHLIDSALRDSLRGSISPKSYNNDIGVPLAIFPADPDHDYLVLELGTNHPGEIRTLTNIAQPDIAIITNCSAEHLEGLGDIPSVRRENATIIEGLATGTLIVNGDDPALLDAVASHRGDCITFGLLPANEISASKIKFDWTGVHFTIEPAGIEAFVPLMGKHTAVNALAAVAVARVLGLPDDQIVRSLATATAPDMRLQRMECAGIRILNDAYNANPASMKAAIETFASLPAAGRKIAILGDMRELGPTSAQSHRDIGKLVAEKCAPDVLVCVGDESRTIATEAMRAGMAQNRVVHFPDSKSAAIIAMRFEPGDLILLKGSRAIGLEIIAHALFGARSQPQAAAS
jgi:UDP-N-acetylmuramoyl-tripeptide--D-alanyl-D-alanine ligase